MKRTWIAGGVLTTVALVFAAVAAGFRASGEDLRPPVDPGSSSPSPGFLYGRVTTRDGAVYEGRLRFGGDQEAFWDDFFNGSKKENRWLAQVPPEWRPQQHDPIEIFGIKIIDREVPSDAERQLVVRFGDVSRIDARGVDVRATLKNGSVFDLDRLEAGDFDDGVRVWDRARGVVDLDSLQIRSIEFLPTPPLETVPRRLYGTVRTRQGEFTGFVLWDRDRCVGTDEIGGLADDGVPRLRLDAVRCIARDSRNGARVTRTDGREVELSRLPQRGIYVDDPRCGRVRISWGAFERVDFLRPGGSGPAYGDFPPGRPLLGTVTSRAGDTLTGRLVFDLDESGTVEILDAPSRGVDYSVPFGRIESIALPRPGGGLARVALRGGETLELELAGDLGEGNAGMLVFAGGREAPEYVPWNEVEAIRFDPPEAN